MSKLNNRKEVESKEGYDTVNTGMPEARFSDTKQVLDSSEMSVSKKDNAKANGDPIDDSVRDSKVNTLKSKIKIRPDVSVDQLDGKQVGGVPLAGTLNTRSMAGVSTQSVADDVSKIPYSKGEYRPESGFGKKRTEDLFSLDNQVCEQVVPIVDDAKDLHEAKDQPQFYAGRKQFKQTRSKKNFHYKNGDNHEVQKLPQQLLNEASCDIIHNSKIVYSSGQMITGDYQSDDVKIPIGMDYPSVLTSRDTNGKYKSSNVDFRMHKGNYLPKNLKIQTTNGKISKIFIEEDYYEVHADPMTRDQANVNLKVDGNNVAKTVIKLQDSLGRETSEEWSPLGYVIHEPYEYNVLLHDIEATTGAVMGAAYRSAVSSLAYQRNIIAKDGVNPQRNAIKMILEGYAGVIPNNDVDTISNISSLTQTIFNQAEYQKGSVAGLIEMFDSVKKYKTKADILGLQRSLTLHLSQADNNINPLRCKPDFIKALNKSHIFSTVDGAYNPMLPIYSTRTIKIMNPLSLNVFLRNWKNPASFSSDDRNDPLRDQNTGTLSNYSYAYSDLRNTYLTRVQHPLVEGLLRWLLLHESAFTSTFGENVNGSDYINIPFEFNMESPNLLSFMLCSASQDVLFERNIIFRDILFVENQARKEYPYEDLVSFAKMDPLYSSQLHIGGYKQALKLGKMSPDTVLREMWNDAMLLCKEQHGVGIAGKAQYMMPWYFNEHCMSGSFTSKKGFFKDGDNYCMSIPSIRDGVRHEYVDVIKSMTDRDVRLSLDRKVTIPVFDTSSDVVDANNNVMFTKHSNYNTSSDLNDYIKFSALRYDPNSDGRLIITYDVTSGNNRNLTHHALLLCPKELGFIDDDLGDLTVVKSYNGTTTVSTTLSNVEALGLGGNSAYVYNGHSKLFVDAYRVEGDSDSSGAIDRSAALSQTFYRLFATPSANLDYLNQKFIDKIGIIPALCYNEGNATEVKGVYNLSSDNESTTALDITIRTLADRIWSVLQRLFFPVNRFENAMDPSTSNVDYDPCEMAFYFGLNGFLASDFSQDVLERLDIFDQLGLDYTEDYFKKNSLIFRAD